MFYTFFFLFALDSDTLSLGTSEPGSYPPSPPTPSISAFPSPPTSADSSKPEHKVDQPLGLGNPPSTPNALSQPNFFALPFQRSRDPGPSNPPPKSRICGGSATTDMPLESSGCTAPPDPIARLGFLRSPGGSWILPLDFLRDHQGFHQALVEAGVVINLLDADQTLIDTEGPFAGVFRAGRHALLELIFPGGVPPDLHKALNSAAIYCLSDSRFPVFIRYCKEIGIIETCVVSHLPPGLIAERRKQMKKFGYGFSFNPPAEIDTQLRDTGAIHSDGIVLTPSSDKRSAIGALISKVPEDRRAAFFDDRLQTSDDVARTFGRVISFNYPGRLQFSPVQYPFIDASKANLYFSPPPDPTSARFELFTLDLFIYFHVGFYPNLAYPARVLNALDTSAFTQLTDFVTKILKLDGKLKENRMVANSLRADTTQQAFSALMHGEAMNVSALILFMELLLSDQISFDAFFTLPPAQQQGLFQDFVDYLSSETRRGIDIVTLIRDRDSVLVKDGALGRVIKEFQKRLTTTLIHYGETIQNLKSRLLAQTGIFFDTTTSVPCKLRTDYARGSGDGGGERSTTNYGYAGGSSGSSGTGSAASSSAAAAGVV